MSSLFSKIHQDIHARSGILSLPHAELQTPVFMPVATQGALKAVSHAEIEAIGYKLILGNTYHLYLRPGTELLKKMGGLHAFTSWKKAYLTDSGGFQVMSLKKLCRIYDNGVEFSSHLDGSKHFFSPESVISFQQVCGSDIIMPLDVCTTFGSSKEEAMNALKLTQNWLSRSKKYWEQGSKKSQLFGIVQGNIYPDLRIRACLELEDLPGIALGGLCLGESLAQLEDIVGLCREHLPSEKPLYCMGIGSPEHLLTAIGQGADMFDCVFPTRIARNASLFTLDGRINIMNSKYKDSTELVAHVMQDQYDYSFGYLHHLFKAKEIMAAMLASQHNLLFIHQLIADAQLAIAERRFVSFKNSFLKRYANV